MIRPDRGAQLLEHWTIIQISQVPIPSVARKIFSQRSVVYTQPSIIILYYSFE